MLFFFFFRCRNKGLERVYSALLEGMLQSELSKLGLQLQTLPPSRPPHLAHFSLQAPSAAPASVPTSCTHWNSSQWKAVRWLATSSGSTRWISVSPGETWISSGRGTWWQAGAQGWAPFWASEFLLTDPHSPHSRQGLVKAFLPGTHSCLGCRQIGGC